MWLGQTYGAIGMNVTKPEEVDGVKEALASKDTPVVINFEIDKMTRFQ